MEPVSEFQELLTNETESDRVNIVKCDHVVSPENVLAICLTKGPSNINLNFTYQNRDCKDLVSLFHWYINCIFRILKFLRQHPLIT